MNAKVLQRRSRLILLLVLTIAITMTSSCASTLGRPHFACEGLPSRPLCLSVTEVYQRTEGQGPPPAEVLTRKGDLR
ncbi:hypothetical protein U5801_22555 [Lamprobacter modestohalophilus]|uniref:hypothetical protein n=1 Tax=Lamprobacter modestohalophilus TaxID=1064514 RepID=UPI002ADEBEA5|nr:hypothetical protein [Lamprobacter modestohalophilus]MEA1052566.1 hypothetical protein [Lamprobacter modestohalophilus]